MQVSMYCPLPQLWSLKPSYYVFILKDRNYHFFLPTMHKAFWKSFQLMTKMQTFYIAILRAPMHSEKSRLLATDPAPSTQSFPHIFGFTSSSFPLGPYGLDVFCSPPTQPNPNPPPCPPSTHSHADNQASKLSKRFQKENIKTITLGFGWKQRLTNTRF